MDPEQTELTLRHLLWLRHDPAHFSILYGDDGEMQCGACLIDFKRDSVKDIEFKFQQIATRKWAEAQLRNQALVDQINSSPRSCRCSIVCEISADDDKCHTVRCPCVQHGEQT